jgi:Nucleotide modification associated domain 1
VILVPLYHARFLPQNPHPEFEQYFIRICELNQLFHVGLALKIGYLKLNNKYLKNQAIREQYLPLANVQTPMELTNQQYDLVVQSCKDIFIKKTKDYGTSWRVLRTISVVDQIFIKAQRIRNIQQLGRQRVGDDIGDEFKGIVNYGVIGLIQLQLKTESIEDLPVEKAGEWYDLQIRAAKNTMEDKNHDYGEAWRDMSQESFVDLILMKLLRIRQILVNDGKTLISEGIDANYTDIINYAVFALILSAQSTFRE